MSSRVLSRLVSKVVYSNQNTTWVTDQKKMISYPFTKIIKEADENWHLSELNCRKTTLANLWLGHQFTLGAACVTWYVDILIG